MVLLRTPRVRSTLTYTTLALGLLLFFFSLGHDGTYTAPLFSSSSSAPSSPFIIKSPKNPHEKLQQQYGDLSLPDAPFVSWPLARLCQDDTAWVPGLVFMCNNNSGGIGNIRNFILTCLRYAIEAGATGFVLPTIETRSKADLAQLFGGQRPFDYFFDTQHFLHSLRDACPSLTVYDRIEDVPNLEVKKPEPLLPKEMGERAGCDYRDLNRHTDAFRRTLHAWVTDSAAKFNLPPMSELYPRVVQPVWGVQWEWPVAKDGAEYTNSVGGLLRFREDILELGKGIVNVMRKRSAGTAAKTGTFAGIHLRTESDALDFWPTFDTQASQFVQSVNDKGYAWVYLATGNTTEAAKLRHQFDAAQKDDNKKTNENKDKDENKVQILTKGQLLKDQPRLLQMLQSMTWDQQALIDYIVLVSCDYFLGVSPSSFSMTIAAKRHLAADGIYTRPLKISDQGDARSRLVGDYSHYWDDWLFMYDALWP